MKGLIDFKNKTLKEITIWAWLGATLPLTGLAAMFFVWAFGFTEYIDILMVLGASSMFLLSVIWWWWALIVIRELIKNWNKTYNDVKNVLDDVVEVKTLVRENFSKKE